MNAVFTQSAVERMRGRDITETDVNRLLAIVERVAQQPGTLTNPENAVRLGREEETFIVRAGEMRAVVTIDPAQPERIIVLSVYRADEAGQPSPDRTLRSTAGAG
ncbi:hypothetical protein Q8W71_25240 [Methylobacterium sp. NEAU 140]|uniref:hypothetical protein n=1 Tax=Methylobacterium sp. NEAU 140 TaxID=3064945 RepID=UPI0027341A06|nr:hypothetical protein [Methylobacterium sp. NEAU 140]MDP4025942.1 hypothetical protein [Methylobacterium sp. NEAU 140]